MTAGGTGRTPGPGAAPDWTGLVAGTVTLLTELARAEPDDAHDPAFCQVCPLCRLMSRLRAVRPDLADQLTGAAEGVGAALHALISPPVPEDVVVTPRAEPDADLGPETDRQAGDAAAPDGRPGPEGPPGWPSTVRPPIERIQVTG